jgi:N-methylhydantoinase A
MKEEALAIVTKAAPKAMLREVRQISMRYAGQGHELNIKIPNEIFSDNHTQILRDLFETEYSKVYGHKLQKTKIEILSWMLTLFEDKNSLFPTSKSKKTESHAEPISRQKFYNSQTKEFIEAPVYERTMIENGCSVKGPALIAEEQTTTVVPIGFACYSDSLGNIVLEKSDA